MMSIMSPFNYFLFICCLIFIVDGRRERRLRESGNEVNKIDKSKYRHYKDGFCELEVHCKNMNVISDEEEVVVPVKLPIRGPRGPEGRSGTPGYRGDDGKPGAPGKPGTSATLPKKVAFFVGLQENIGPVTEHMDIVFDQVVTNVGSGYNPETGHFVAPVNGTYQFNVIVSAQGRQKAAVMIINKGAMVATVWAESIPYWATASNIVILSLHKGEEVWLMVLNRASYLHGYMYTTFSGFLIFEN